MSKTASLVMRSSLGERSDQVNWRFRQTNQIVCSSRRLAQLRSSYSNPLRRRMIAPRRLNASTAWNSSFQLSSGSFEVDCSIVRDPEDLNTLSTNSSQRE